MVSRPRLADHVVARLSRLHAQDRLVLIDAARDRAVVLPASAWSVLCHADGTRDLEGIVAAARRFGAGTDLQAAGRFFDELAALAWLAEGPSEGLLEGEAQPVAAGDTRVIREMVAGRYRCDGRGDCCRSYPTISLTPADVHRVCATMHDDPSLAHRSHRAFLPTVGSAPTPMRALGLVDGACRFLEADGACAVHRRGGPNAKPIGCAWFPARLTDDGMEIRAAPAVECICVARPDPGAAPLVPVVAACDLPLGITLVRIPTEIGFAGDLVVDRETAIASLDALAPEDPARTAWAWGSALTEARAWIEPPRSPIVDATAVARRFAAVAQRASIRAHVEATWRAEDDVVCRRLRLLALAAGLLAAPTAAALVVATDGDAALERHVFDVAVFSRALLATGDAAKAACDLALQMWLARATAALVSEDHDVTLREAPLAAVAATWRAQRLGD